ncbi:MAG TPA: helix-turn-helix transcriptional regulator [Egibacteraceae bacterium]|nr:helix-turn-helix transcriptional regulator [Egibacteraceae bacterium]
MGGVAAELLRDARLRAGLSQAELARRAATSQPTLSAYERGEKDPSVATLARLLAVAGTNLAGTEGAATVRDFLRQAGGLPATFSPERLVEVAGRVIGGEDAWFAVREFLDGVGLVAEVADPPRVRRLIADRPPPTGDRRVDTLLAGVAEHLAGVHVLDRPAWVTEPDRFLEAWWFPHRRAFDALAIRDSPPAFRRRGIFLCPSALERV